MLHWFPGQEDKPIMDWGLSDNTLLDQMAF